MIENFAQENGIDPKLLKAVIAVEAGGSGFNADGSLKIRFEVHLALDENPVLERWFKTGSVRFLHHYMRFPSFSTKWRVVHTGNPDDEFTALLIAAHTVGHDAWRYASYGVGQILAKFHYEKLGFQSPIQMYSFMSQSRENDIGTWLKLIALKPEFLIPLQQRDLRAFIMNYNGSGQVQTYLDRMNTELSKL